MGSDAEELISPPASSPEPEQDDDDEDCYLSDREDDALEESVLQVLEDGHLEDCHWSASSVRTSLARVPPVPLRPWPLPIASHPLTDSLLACVCR